MKAPLLRLALVALALAGSMSIAASCTASPTAPPIGQFGGRAVLGISNGTPLAVTLYVNGEDVGTSMPEVAFEPLDFAVLPSLPWTVEARTASGRVLTSMVVRADSVSDTRNPSGYGGTTGAFGRVDLSCGRITIWAGYNQPSGPVPPSLAGSPGDCSP